MRYGLAALCLGLLCLAAPARERVTREDAFAAALRDMGIAEADLGYRPKAHWARYPHPRTIPHVLPFFSDLLATPLDTYEFTRTLGNAAEDLLNPETLTAAPTEKDRKETLFRLGVILGTDRMIGGFRGYSANLDPRTVEPEPLLNALVTLLERSGKPLRRPMSFGARYAKDEPGPREALRKQVAEVPEPLRLPLARFVLNLVQAREWIDLGLRDVPMEMRQRVFDALPKLSDETPDGTGYDPVFDDVAKRIDAHSLYYGCLKALQATQDARREIGAVPEPEDGWPGFHFRLETPWGVVRFDETVPGDEGEADPLLWVALSVNNMLWEPLGATSAGRTLSVALLFDFATTAGVSHGMELDEWGGVAELASGVLGCGILYATGDRSAAYRTGRFGQGCGVFGLGALIDEGGGDVYKACSMAQGAGFFGIGLLLDAGGDDEHFLLEGDGQGYGGPGGVGILANRSGDDLYRSEPDASKAGREDYHSRDEVAVSNAQGAGSGRRGDGSDGHSWAGGLGALLDVDGNDRYIAGNFSQGLGYWYGTGLLWDGGGHDRYVSVYFTQGSGAHFAVGALIDEGGDDVHVLGNNAGAAFGFGWDVVNAFLIDRGRGNDRYVARIISTGLAEVRSNAFFLDEGGDDVYVLREGTKGFGDVDERKSYTEPGRTHTYPLHLGQVGVFLDLSGNDRYLRIGKDGRIRRDAEAGDARTWNLRGRVAGTRTGPNVSIGRDLAGGRIGFLDDWPAREVKK